MKLAYGAIALIAGALVAVLTACSALTALESSPAAVPLEQAAVSAAVLTVLAKDPTAAPRIDLAFASTVFLTVIVAGLGLWPEPLLEAGRRAAVGLLDPHAYVSAVGLAGGAL